MSIRDLNKLAIEVHTANQRWWQDIKTGKPIQRNKGELLMLMVSEVSEAMEGERKDLMDDHLPHRKMVAVEMADLVIRVLDYIGGYKLCISEIFIPHIPDNKGEALLDIVKQILLVHTMVLIDDTKGESQSITNIIYTVQSYCEKYNYDLWGAVDEKLAYNVIRADHKTENRRAMSGKKW